MSSSRPLALRHFHHVRIRIKGGAECVLPLIVHMHTHDLDALAAHSLPRIIADVLWILKLHSKSILPSAHADSPAFTTQPLENLPLYHGEIVSCVYTLTQEDAHVEVLTFKPQGETHGFQAHRVMPYHLVAYVYDKAREHERRSGAAPVQTGLEAFLHRAAVDKPMGSLDGSLDATMGRKIPGGAPAGTGEPKTGMQQAEDEGGVRESKPGM